MTAQLELAAPAPDYEAVKAVNWSSLKHIHVSPLLYQYHLANPPERTAALAFGAAKHCALLEPDEFEKRYAVYDGVRRGKAWEEWQAEHVGAGALKPDDIERVQRSVDAIRKHRVAGRLIAACRFEEVTTWTDPETGLRCKGRLDGISPCFVVDLKGTAAAEPRKFRNAASDYLYHGQLAFYQDGATLAGKIDGKEMPWIIASQNDPPFDVWPFELPAATLMAGRVLYRSLLRRLVQCIEADWYPGAVPDSELLDLPPWAAGQGESDSLTQEDF